MLKPRMHYGWGVLALALALVLIQIIAGATGKNFYLTQLTMSAYYSMVVMGLCFVMGYAGQVSMGHAAFFALGGYATAVLTTTDVSGWAGGEWQVLGSRLGLLIARQDVYGAHLITVAPGAAFLVGLALSLIAALLIGYPAHRLKGHYLAMATLGFGLIVYRIVLGSEFTGAADGISSVPPWELPGGLMVAGKKAVRVENYYIAWGLTLLTLYLLLNLIHSRMGRAWTSIHGGETAANAMGVDTGAYKLKAFVLSALIASAAGSLMTHFNGGIGPSEADAMKSVRYLALVAAGGMANLWGALLVSAVLNFLSLRGLFGSFDHAVFGVLLIVIISGSPQGRARWKKIFTRRRAVAATSGPERSPPASPPGGPAHEPA